jgi:hypothetical protein
VRCHFPFSLRRDPEMRAGGDRPSPETA